MKNYKITVNGNTYDVSVEAEGGDIINIQPAPAVMAAPVQKAPAPVQKPAAPKAPPAPKASAAPKAAPAPTGGGEDVTAPLSGNVLSVNVAVGDAVKTGQVLLIFEAMKMENELVAPRDGTVTAVNVKKGDVLETGAVVVSIA